MGPSCRPSTQPPRSSCVFFDIMECKFIQLRQLIGCLYSRQQMRLTFNYWRKGGYNVGSEDYRWSAISVIDFSMIMVLTLITGRFFKNMFLDSFGSSSTLPSFPSSRAFFSMPSPPLQHTQFFCPPSSTRRSQPLIYCTLWSKLLLSSANGSATARCGVSDYRITIQKQLLC